MTLYDSYQQERQVLQDVESDVFQGYVLEGQYHLIHIFKRLLSSGYIDAVNASSRDGLQFLKPSLTQLGVERLRYLAS